MKLKFSKKVSLILCAVICCVALSVALLVPTVAQAYNTIPGSGVNKIGEIYQDNATTGGSFDRANLEALLDALKATGTTLDEKIASLKTKVDSSTTTSGNGSGANRTYDDSLAVSTFDSTIIVRFGGIDWIPVLLSLPNDDLLNDKGSTGNTPNSKDVILTLWQATGVEGNEKTSSWCDTSTNGFGTSSQNTNFTYPANMYSTSKIRNVTLNNGGYYTTTGANLVKASQSESNTYAKFTMSQYTKEPGGEVSSTSKASKISEFLVAPRYLEWQQNGRIGTDWSWGAADKNRNNDAWGTQGKNNFYSSNGTYYWYEDRTTGNGTFDAWKDDLIWIPSAAEVGNYYSNRENQGIWKTVQSTQRASSEIAWLRTANLYDYYHAYSLAADGALSNYAVAESHLVRPALHLNLTSAAKAANTVDKPTESKTKDVVYNGSAYTFETGIDTSLVDQKLTIAAAKDGGTVALSDKDGKKVLNATATGTYTVTVTLKEGYRWENPDSLTDTETLTYTFTIHKRKVDFTVAVPSSQSSFLTYGTAFNLTSPSDYYKYKEDTVPLASESSTDYTESNYYQFLTEDANSIQVFTPVSSTSAFAVPGTHPLYLDLGSLTSSSSNYVITYSGNFASAGSADSSTYSQYDGKAATVTVTNAKITVNNLTVNQTFVYTLSATDVAVGRKIEVTDITTVGQKQATVRYEMTSSTRTSGDYTQESNNGPFTVSKAGQYVIKVTVSAQYHDDWTETITVTISKATATLVVTVPEGKVYTNKTLPTLNCTASLNGQTVYGSISWTRALDSITVSGQYDFGWRWIPNDDSIEEQTGEKNLDVEVVDNAITKTDTPASTTYVYDGIEHVIDLVSDRDKEKLDINITSGGNNASIVLRNGRWVLSATKAGTYTVTLRPNGDNYWDGNETDQTTLTLTLQIDQREVWVKVVVPSGVATSLVYGNRFVLSGNAADYWTYDNNSPYQFLRNSDAVFTVSCGASSGNDLPSCGTYPLTLRFDGDGDNYKISVTSTLNVEITKAQLDVSDIESSFNQTYVYGYTGSVDTPTTHALTIDTARIKAVGTPVIKVSYSNASASLGEWNGSEYVVSKVGTYTVTVTISADNHFDVVRTLTVTITKAKANVMPAYDSSGEILTSGTLPAINATATVSGCEVQGTIRWITSLGSVTSSGSTAFTWQWAPNDAENIEISEGVAYLTVTLVGVSKFTVVFDAGDRVFYDTDTLSDLKNYLTVTVTFTDGKVKVLGMNEYTLTCQGGTNLVVGENVGITVTYMSAGNPITQTFRVNVLQDTKPPVDDPNPTPPDDPTPTPPDDPTQDDPTPDDPNNNGDNQEKGPSLWEKIKDFVENTPLPLGYVAAVLGAELLLIIILAIAARRPKTKK